MNTDLIATPVNEISTGDVVIIDGSRYRVMFRALVRGIDIELTIKSTAGRLSPEMRRTFSKYQSILKVA